MADAKDATAASGAAEPSMEEILASIRKIISDDNDPATANGAAAGADVLELTQMVQEDGSVVDMKSSASFDPPMPPSAPEKPKAAPAAMSPASNLVSPPAASAAAAALSSLASTVEIEKLASAPPMTATFIGNGARTLEDMTMELMKPLLKEWLDKNLPPIVDRLVQKEIERISKKAQE